MLNVFVVLFNNNYYLHIIQAHLVKSQSKLLDFAFRILSLSVKYFLVKNLACVFILKL